MKDKKAGHQKFEGCNPTGRFAKITHEMMSSSAWKDLNLRQHGLYLAIKAKYIQKVVRGIVEQSNRDNISFTKKEALELYGDNRTFQKDKKALIDHGFIRLEKSGYRMRACNIYALDDAWQKWVREKEPHQPSVPPPSLAPSSVFPNTDGTLYKGGGLSHHENTKVAD